MAVCGCKATSTALCAAKADILCKCCAVFQEVSCPASTVAAAALTYDWQVQLKADCFQQLETIHVCRKVTK
jgi:hypothetical protein